jgi:hypothetical protein
MGEQSFRPREPRFSAVQPLYSEGRVHYLLEAEEQILRSIAARAPVAQILNDICTALDCQLGNMVSLISLPQDDVANSLEIARSAERFGLHIFFSGAIFSESGKALGSLEMYCCTARDASGHELQLIERATCLAAIAMECDGQEERRRGRRKLEKGLPQANSSGWPVSIN